MSSLSVVVCRRLSLCRLSSSLVVSHCLSSPQFSAAKLKVEKLRPLKSGGRSSFMSRQVPVPCSYPCYPTPCCHQIHQHSKFPAASSIPRSRPLAALTATGHFVANHSIHAPSIIIHDWRWNSVIASHVRLLLLPEHGMSVGKLLTPALAAARI